TLMLPPLPEAGALALRTPLVRSTPAVLTLVTLIAPPLPLVEPPSALILPEIPPGAAEFWKTVTDPPLPVIPPLETTLPATVTVPVREDVNVMFCAVAVALLLRVTV